VLILVVITHERRVVGEQEGASPRSRGSRKVFFEPMALLRFTVETGVENLAVDDHEMELLFIEGEERTTPCPFEGGVVLLGNRRNRDERSRLISHVMVTRDEMDGMSKLLIDAGGECDRFFVRGLYRQRMDNVPKVNHE
jgi:hypothetical protein